MSPSQRVSSSQHTAAQTLADLVSSPSADLVSSPSQNLQVQDANLSQNSVAEIVSSPSQNLQAQDANLSQNSAAQILFGLRRNADTGDVPEVTNDNINEIRLKLGLESDVNIKRVQNRAGPLRSEEAIDLNNYYWCEAIFIHLLKYINKINFSYQKRFKKFKNLKKSASQVQKIPNFGYQIYQTLQI